MAKTRSRRYQEQRTWQAFSKYIRTRDCIRNTGTLTEGVCFTCGAHLHYSQLQAGHIVSRSYGAALYNPQVVFSQCVDCNYKREGNHILGYFALCNLVGQEQAEKIVMAAMRNEPHSIEELEDIEEGCLLAVEILEAEYERYAK